MEVFSVKPGGTSQITTFENITYISSATSLPSVNTGLGLLFLEFELLFVFRQKLLIWHNLLQVSTSPPHDMYQTQTDSSRYDTIQIHNNTYFHLDVVEWSDKGTQMCRNVTNYIK